MFFSLWEIYATGCHLSSSAWSSTAPQPSVEASVEIFVLFEQVSFSFPVFFTVLKQLSKACYLGREIKNEFTLENYHFHGSRDPVFVGEACPERSASWLSPKKVMSVTPYWHFFLFSFTPLSWTLCRIFFQPFNMLLPCRPPNHLSIPWYLSHCLLWTPLPCGRSLALRWRQMRAWGNNTSQKVCCRCSIYCFLGLVSAAKTSANHPVCWNTKHLPFQSLFPLFLRFCSTLFRVRVPSTLEWMCWMLLVNW